MHSSALHTFLGFSLLFFSDDDVQCHFTQLFFQTSLGEWDRSRIGWMCMKSAFLSFGLTTRHLFSATIVDYCIRWIFILSFGYLDLVIVKLWS